MHHYMSILMPLPVAHRSKETSRQSTTLPWAFISAREVGVGKFRQQCLQAFTDHKALDFMFEQCKGIALKEDWDVTEHSNGPKNRKIEIKGKDDFICLTDIAKYKNPEATGLNQIAITKMKILVADHRIEGLGKEPSK